MKHLGIEKKSLLGEIITILEPKIEERIMAIRNYRSENKLPPLSEFSEKCERMYLIYDLSKSVLKYSLPTDTLIEFHSGISGKGNYQLICKVGREDKEYGFSTEVIMAGGYNIQRLHYRYITRTDLPQIKNNPIILENIKKQIKQNTKIEKLEKDVELYKGYVLHNMEQLNMLEGLKTREDKVKYYTRNWEHGDTIVNRTWDSLNEYGKSNYGTEENFKASEEADFNEWAHKVDFEKENTIKRGIYLDNKLSELITNLNNEKLK